MRVAAYFDKAKPASSASSVSEKQYTRDTCHQLGALVNRTFTSQVWDTSYESGASAHSV
jgi:hypothetical protein